VAGETEVLGGNLPRAALSTTDPRRLSLVSNPDRRYGKLSTNRLRYGTITLEVNISRNGTR
jgi:hypothetical protein